MIEWAYKIRKVKKERMSVSESVYGDLEKKDRKQKKSKRKRRPMIERV